MFIDDTPYAVPNVPVTMTVTAPATWGKLEGVVASLGYCDVNPHPLEGAQVVIETNVGDTITVTTDVNGHYSYWFDQAASPLIVTASAPDHDPGTATGIVISGGMTTTLNFDLHWLEPCYQVSLTPPTDAKFGAQGVIVDYTLHIVNTGSVANTFTFVPSGNAWNVVVPAPVALNAGASADVVVHVYIPHAALLGAFDIVTITASGAGGATDSSVLTTTVNLLRMFLPILRKDA